MVGETTSSLLKPSEQVVEKRLEVLLENAETRECFLMTLSYCCSTSKAENESIARHSAGKQLF